jgi:hypothetical protein
MELPRPLRTAFLANAAVHVLAALPLLAAPTSTLQRLGWTAVDPVSARLVGAALLAIGGAAFFARDAGAEVTRALLRLNLLWSSAAAFALFAGIAAGAPPAAWAFLSIFIVMTGVWLHHTIRFRQLARAAALDDSPLAEEDEDEPPEGPPG